MARVKPDNFPNLPDSQSWAALEPGGEINREALTGNDLKIWRSGDQVTAVDCVSPFNPGERFREMFLGEAHND